MPNDLAAAHAMLRVERAARHIAETQLAERDAAIARQVGEVAALRLEIERLKLLLAKARREQFGRSSERGARLVAQLELQLAELVREKALWLTRDEVPHAISVELEEIEDKVVRASILVETESQKQIVVGKGGAIVKEIGTRARPEIEALLGHPVFLELKVKVRPRWRRDAATLERLGL